MFAGAQFGGTYFAGEFAPRIVTITATARGIGTTTVATTRVGAATATARGWARGAAQASRAVNIVAPALGVARSRSTTSRAVTVTGHAVGSARSATQASRAGAVSGSALGWGRGTSSIQRPVSVTAKVSGLALTTSTVSRTVECTSAARGWAQSAVQTSRTVSVAATSVGWGRATSTAVLFVEPITHIAAAARVVGRAWVTSPATAKQTTAHLIGIARAKTQTSAIALPSARARGWIATKGIPTRIAPGITASMHGWALVRVSVPPPSLPIVIRHHEHNRLIFHERPRRLVARDAEIVGRTQVRC